MPRPRLNRWIYIWSRVIREAKRPGKRKTDAGTGLIAPLSPEDFQSCLSLQHEAPEILASPEPESAGSVIPFDYRSLEIPKKKIKSVDDPLSELVRAQKAAGVPALLKGDVVRFKDTGKGKKVQLWKPLAQRVFAVVVSWDTEKGSGTLNPYPPGVDPRKQAVDEESGKHVLKVKGRGLASYKSARGEIWSIKEQGILGPVTENKEGSEEEAKLDAVLGVGDLVTCSWCDLYRGATRVLVIQVRGHPLGSWHAFHHFVPLVQHDFADVQTIAPSERPATESRPKFFGAARLLQKAGLPGLGKKALNQEEYAQVTIPQVVSP